MQKVRPVTHYIVLPVELADTPIPMVRFAYTPETIDEETGEVTQGTPTFYTANQLAPKARKSVDGSKMVLGLELDNLFEAISELNEFPHKEELQVLSHKETLTLMQSEEWTATNDEVTENED